MLPQHAQQSEKDVTFHNTHHTFDGEKSFDYDQIDEHIYIGANTCCIVGYSQELLEKKVVADISLEAERIDNPDGAEFFLWLPTLDGTPPTPRQLALGVAAITFFVENNINVYVHCKKGHGRAPTLVAAYYVSTGMSVEDAITTIKKKRSVIHPEPEQVAALQAFSQSR